MLKSTLTADFSAEPTLEACKVAFHAGDLVQAESLCQALLTRDGACGDAHNILGVIYKNRHQYDQALTCFRNAINCDMDQAKYYVNLGAVYLDRCYLDDAEEALLHAVELDPTLYQARINLGNLYFEREFYSEALTHYLYAYEQCDATADALAKLVATFTALEQPDKAHAVCQTFLQQHSNPEAFAQVAEIYSQNDFDVECLDTFDAGLKTFPNHAPLYCAQAMFYFHRSRLDNALEVVNRGLKAVPGSGELMTMLGSIYLKMQDFDAALSAFDQAITAQPDKPEFYYNKSGAFLSAKRFDEALSVLDDCFSIVPEHKLDSWHMQVGRMLFEKGNYRAAAKAYDEAIICNPENVEAYAAQGRCWVYYGNNVKARACYDLALRRDPEHVASLVAMSGLRMESGNHVIARDLLTKALELKPDHMEGRCLKAHQLITQGNFDEADVLLNEVLRAHPAFARAVAARALLYEKLKRYDDALEAFEAVDETSFAHEPMLISSYSVVLQRFKRMGKAIDLLNKHAYQHDYSPRQRMPLLFRLGDCYDNLGEYDKAWAAYDEANQQKKIAHRAKSDWKKLERIQEIFTPETIPSYPISTNTSDLPIYIVGMPRSGTSLTEQILDSHPLVCGAGELDYVGKIVIRMRQNLQSKYGFPRIVPRLTQQMLNGFSYKLIEHMQAFAPEAQHITDKMPHNFGMLGLIQMLVPRSKVLHINRNPLDTCLSCYFQNFASGHEYSFRLDLLGEHYKVYRAMMAHWKDVLDLAIFDVDYEALVSDPDSNVREILGFVGLEWSDACLNFHSSDRVVRTASYDQVRQPLYTKSAGRWKNYEKHLGPLIKALEPLDL